jgi:hypothetical protein
MERTACRRAAFATVISLILIGVISISSTSQVSAQKVPTQTSKTNEIISQSKFKESIAQFKRKQQQQQQQSVINQQQQQLTIENEINEQQVIEQQRQQNLLVIGERKTSASQQVAGQSFVAQQQQTLDSQAESIYGSVKGAPGVDFPNYSTIPNTKFSCDGVPFEPGMYADESTDCQVYHLCYQGRRESFLCGVGTVFNQAILNCDFWHSVECSKSRQFYGLNAEFGKSSSEPDGNSVQTSFRSSVSQLKRTFLPPTKGIQQQQQAISQVQKHSVELPPPPVGRLITSLDEERVQSSRSASSGKTSLPKQQLIDTNYASHSLSLSGGTKSGPSSSAVGGGVSSFQRSSARAFVSPVRKAAQLSASSRSASQQQFASAESAPMQSYTTNGVKSKGPRGPQRVVSSLVVSSGVVDTKGRPSHVEASQLVNAVDVGARKAASPKGDTLRPRHNAKSSKASSSSSSVESKHSGPVQEANGDGVWKPYFKSKTSAAINKSSSGRDGPARPEAPVRQGPSPTSATTSAAPTTLATSDVAGGGAGSAPSTLAQPDQEPTFSSDGGDSGGSSSPSAESTATPSVPKSSAPPEVPATTGTPEPGEGTASPAVIEPDVGASLSSTAPTETSGSSEATTTGGPTTTAESPSAATTAESPPETTLTPAAAAATTTTTTAAPKTTSSSSTYSDTPTTIGTAAAATTTSASPTETPAAATTTTTAATPTTTTTPASRSENETPAGGTDDEKDEPAKAKRATQTAGVEYASDGKPVGRTNSSSVEYATGERARAPSGT